MAYQPTFGKIGVKSQTQLNSCPKTTTEFAPEKMAHLAEIEDIPQHPHLIRNIVSLTATVAVACLVAAFYFANGSAIGSVDNTPPEQQVLEELAKPNPDLKKVAALIDALKMSSGLGDPPRLKLLEWSCNTEYGYTTIQGRVKNTSAAPIENLEARGTFFASDKSFVKADAALVDFRPLMPNQTTTFKVMTSHNPVIKKCDVAFNEFMGPAVNIEK